MTDTTTVASTPTPTIQALVFSLLRSVLMLLSALGIGFGATVSDSTLMIASGIIVSIGTAAWSLFDKVQSARRAHTGAVASAQSGVAVKTA